MTPNWNAVEAELFREGYACVPGVLDAAACAQLRGMYDDDAHFRSRVIMEAHNFGRGEYRYFGYPLPPLVERLRAECYLRLAPVANRWMEALRMPARFPAGYQDMLAFCADHGQARPTALLLKYRGGDYNCLHQDVYGEIAFPLQVTLFLSEPGRDYTGGEFVLTEQRPRAQTRAEVVVPGRGDMIVFPNRYRPVAGKAGTYRTALRHGVSRVRSGERFTLGLIFHDAR